MTGLATSTAGSPRRRDRLGLWTRRRLRVEVLRALLADVQTGHAVVLDPQALLQRTGPFRAHDATVHRPHRQHAVARAGDEGLRAVVQIEEREVVVLHRDAQLL